MRMEERIKDNLDVAVQNLGKSILRKVDMESGYWKVLRAKRDYCEKEYNQL